MRRELQANNVYALDTTKLKISRNESLENHHVIIFYLIFQYENHGLTDKKVLKTYINACKLCLVLEDAVFSTDICNILPHIFYSNNRTNRKRHFFDN